jgi:MoxR-like ATPase/Arc/MetJ family transcription regulator
MSVWREAVNNSLKSALEDRIIKSNNVSEQPLNLVLNHPLPRRIRFYGSSISRTDRGDGEELKLNVRIDDSEEMRPDRTGNCLVVIGGCYVSEPGKDIDLFEEHEELYFMFVDDDLIPRYGGGSDPYPMYCSEETFRDATKYGIGTYVPNTKSYSKGGETVFLAREDYVGSVLRRLRRLKQLRSLLDGQLSYHNWREDPTRRQVIERVIDNFLVSTDQRERTFSRLTTAQDLLLKRDSEDEFSKEKVEDYCGPDLWTDTEDGLSSKQRFSRLLEEVEAIWSADSPVESFSDLGHPPSTDHASVFDDDASIGMEIPSSYHSELHFPDSVVDEADLVKRIDAALRSGRHIILTGPPGSGKTELAEAICDHYRSDDYQITTATSDWSTFETIGGYRPDGDDGGLEFSPGLFLERFADEEMNPRNEWLVVDELNRASIDKAFGSLFTVLTGENVTLPYTDTDDGEARDVQIVGDPDTVPDDDIRQYHVPDDWRMIATMNAADKSALYQMSYAFMRRFTFVEVPIPTVDDVNNAVPGDYFDCWNLDIPSPDKIDLEDEFDTRNELEGQLRDDLGTIWAATLRRDIQIGPGLIEDIAQHVVSELRTAEELSYDQAIAGNLLPQFEGNLGILNNFLREIENRVDALNGEAAVSRRFAETHLGVEFEDDEE